MEKNPDYFLGAPKLDRVFVRIVLPSVMVAALERGEIDYTTGSGTGDIPLADWDRVRQMSNVTAHSFVNRGYQYIIINFENPRFRDRRVRQGLLAGINRKLIVDRLLRGEGEVLDVPYTSIFPYRDKGLRAVDYDADRARQLLREGGWDFSTPLVLSVPTGNLVREQSAEIVQQNYQALGMQVRIEKFDFPTLISNLRDSRFQLSFLGWSGNFEPDVSSQYRTGGGFNFGKHSNPSMDSLLDRGRRRPNFDGRKEIYDQFQRMFQGDPPVIMLYSPKALTAVNKRLVNAVPTANIHLWNIHEWDMR
jgi:peptide/nickel transport system substrate-binding protein